MTRVERDEKITVQRSFSTHGHSAGGTTAVPHGELREYSFMVHDALLCLGHAFLCRRHLHHLGQRRRPPERPLPLLHGKDAGRYPGRPWCSAIHANPSHLIPVISTCAATRGCHARTSRHESSHAAARRGHLAWRRVEGRRGAEGGARRVSTLS